MPQGKIHTAPVKYILMATSSSTTSWSPFSAGEGYSRPFDKSKFEILLYNKNGSGEPFLCLFMIFCAFDDIEASVDAFKQDHAHKLVGKGEL